MLLTMHSHTGENACCAPYYTFLCWWWCQSVMFCVSTSLDHMWLGQKPWGDYVTWYQSLWLLSSCTIPFGSRYRALKSMKKTSVTCGYWILVPHSISYQISRILWSTTIFLILATPRLQMAKHQLLGMVQSPYHTVEMLCAFHQPFTCPPAM